MTYPNYPPYGVPAPYVPPMRRERRPMSAAAKALIAALLALAVMITGSAVVLIADGFETYYGGGDPYSESEGGIPLTPEDEGWYAPIPNPDAPEIELHAPGTAENMLADREAAAKVSPSVVCIVSYTYNWDHEKELYSEGSGVVITTF